jgi:hypothetical protein
MFTRFLRKAQQIFFKIKKRLIRFLFRLHDSFLPSMLSSQKIEKPYFNTFIQKADSVKPYFLYLKNANFFEKPLNRHFCFLGSGWFDGTLSEQLKPEVNRANRSRAAEIRLFIAKSHQQISKKYLPIDWQKDHKSGYRWSEKTWYADIVFGKRPGVDIKVPWELSRMQHLLILAMAEKSLFFVGNRKLAMRLASDCRDQVLDFIAQNPPRWGVNWVSAMDVAIRAVNWLVAFDLYYANHRLYDTKFLSYMKASLVDHGKFIRHHLSWDPYFRGNHYLSELAGLIFIGAYLSDMPLSDRWLAFAVPRFLAELFVQFNPDGSNFEASTCYHALAAEIVLYTLSLLMSLPPERLEKAGLPQPWLTDAIRDRVKAIGDFLSAITMPDGNLLQMGDNDGGRFIKLFPDCQSDTGSILRDFRELDAQYETLITLLDGPQYDPVAFQKVLFRGANRKFTPRVSQSSVGWSAYKDFGLYIYHDAVFSLAVRCGPVGQHGFGGHAHNDQLSFELAIHQLPVFVDPGTGVYTSDPAARNRYRSTAFHNTLMIEGREQNPISPEARKLFLLPEKSFAAGLITSDGAFSGSHCGYGIVHHRCFTPERDRLLTIEDSISAEIPKQVIFHLDPQVGSLRKSADDRWIMRIQDMTIALMVRGNCRSWKENYLYSPNYGVFMPAEKIIFKTDMKKIQFLIRLVS